MNRKVAHNLAWLVGERVAVTLLVFVSNVYVIRYLGAARFGELALFQVWLALTLTCTEFGLRRVFLALGHARAVRLVLAATVRVKVGLGALLALAIVVTVLVLGARVEFLLLTAVALLAPFEAYVYRFEAQLRNDLLARIRIGLAIGLAAVRVALCAAGFGVPAIAATYIVPGISLGLVCRFLARREDAAAGAPRAAGERRLAAVQGHVLRRSTFFFGSVILVQLHSRCDQLLLNAFAGSAELGLYAGAFKFLEQSLMLPSMLTAVLLPALSRRSASETAKSLEQVYFAILVLALGLAAVFSLAARPLVAAVLGPEFAPSAKILAILAWGIPGLFVASASGLFYSVNGLEQWSFVRNLIGLATGATLGLVLIPLYGAQGAAWSMVASYSFLAFGAEWCSAHFRRNARLKAKALGALFSVRQYGALVQRMAGHSERQ
jgi:O-antigen/teichoic acid export membrane protein